MAKKPTKKDEKAALPFKTDDKETTAGRKPYPIDQEAIDKILEITATSNRSLASIVSDIDNIGVTTVYKWLRDNEQFAKDYARAKEDQADFLAEEILQIADDSTKDIVQGEHGTYVDHENIQRSKLRVDTRKWLASKLKAKKYGDKLDMTTNGGGLVFRVGYKKKAEDDGSATD